MLNGKEAFFDAFGVKDLKEQLAAEATINGLIMKGIELSHSESRLRP